MSLLSLIFRMPGRVHTPHPTHNPTNSTSPAVPHNSTKPAVPQVQHADHTITTHAPVHVNQFQSLLIEHNDPRQTHMYSLVDNKGLTTVHGGAARTRVNNVDNEGSMVIGGL